MSIVAGPITGVGFKDILRLIWGYYYVFYHVLWQSGQDIWSY